MSRDSLPEETVREEIERLLGPEVLGWWKTQNGIDWHVTDKNTSHVYGIHAAMLEHLVEDAVKQGMRPAYIIGYVALRIWGCMPEYRNEIEKIIPDWNTLDGVYLDDQMEQRVKAFERRERSKKKAK